MVQVLQLIRHDLFVGMSVGVYVSIVNRKPRIGMTWNLTHCQGTVLRRSLLILDSTQSRHYDRFTQAVTYQIKLITVFLVTEITLLTLTGNISHELLGSRYVDTYTVSVAIVILSSKVKTVVMTFELHTGTMSTFWYWQGFPYMKTYEQWASICISTECCGCQ